MLIIPGVILSLLGFAPPVEPWIRVVGVLSLVLGYFFTRAALANLKAFYPWTVHARFGVTLAIILLVVLNLAPINLLLFAVFDFLSALWTFWALRGEAAA